MPQPTQIAEISQIFLSATAQDCRSYREAVRDALQRNVDGAQVWLQEDWAAGGQFVVEVCRDKVCSRDAYLGLFGHRYGWIPPDHSKSITELEFGWALERWPRQQAAPIFVFLPLPGSEADDRLRAWAAACFRLECPDEASRRLQDQRQSAFLNLVRSWAAGRILLFYEHEQELREKAIASVNHWNLALLRRAIDDRRQVKGDIPADELGRIGREPQRRALTDALAAFHDRPGQRAVAFLVHGRENHGQREFAEWLARSDEPWDECGDDFSLHCGQPGDADSSESLIRWVGSELREPVIGEAAIEALAVAVAAALARRSLVFIQRSAGQQAQRLLHFCQDFWQPLLAALARRPAAGSGRLYWFVVDHACLAGECGGAVCSDEANGGAVDCERLLALPELGAITASQVRTWLGELRKSVGIDLGADRRQQIADYATHPDGNPANVYDRLQREGFWANATSRKGQ
ncbi:DUF4062 domain-containing protein [Accumulibacter sp.]|uniref:DUF4062 domain-containing protein n=2 Tax=Accumulibacter sp. TaxID=2053492 RepID=UPI0025E8CC91|nr:DUF4062 domain-containing protein [Accumulibacter sp.]MCM8662001.1 DUF4062 domain-containing protein [Accumulibacter sp.]